MHAATGTNRSTPGTAAPTESALDVDWVFERYEQVRTRLPDGRFPGASQNAHSLADLTHAFDVFLLDAFGVLNVGDAPVPGAPAAVAALQAAGKTLLVLTNGASLEAADALAKYRQFGFAFEARQVISSRDLLVARLRSLDPALLWGVAAPARSRVELLAPRAARLVADATLFERADGFILLSTDGWGPADNARLGEALVARPRPVLVGNPDVVSPREVGFKLEPGHYAHSIAESTGVEPEFFGKPFANAFDEVGARLTTMGCPAVDPGRVAMVGDTLHTDILGGAAAGFRTVLVNDHGLFRGRDPRPYIARSGLVPDFVIATT